VHVVFPRLDPPYAAPLFLSRTAADYGIDFTVGIQAAITADQLEKVLMTCPGIRGVALEANSPAQAAVFAALRQAGRRVTLDLDGATAETGVLKAAAEQGIPLLRPPVAWPPSFEAAIPLDPSHPRANALLYWVFGRLGYDPKTPVPKGASLDEYDRAREAGLWMAAAQQSNLGGSDYIASAAEAARNYVEHTVSAKFVPAEIARHLDAAAAQLSKSENPEFALLARMAGEQAEQQRSVSANLPPPARSLPHLGVAIKTPEPSWTHTPPASAPSEHALSLTLHLPKSKEVSAVRLHYRTLDPEAATKVLETSALPETVFAIPASDITGNWDLRYYFEIVDKAGNAWFAPDPLNATPYWTVHVIAPHEGRN
jgi:hypothetical protein